MTIGVNIDNNIVLLGLDREGQNRPHMAIGVILYDPAVLESVNEELVADIVRVNGAFKIGNYADFNLGGIGGPLLSLKGSLDRPVSIRGHFLTVGPVPSRVKGIPGRYLVVLKRDPHISIIPLLRFVGEIVGVDFGAFPPVHLLIASF